LSSRQIGQSVVTISAVASIAFFAVASIAPTPGNQPLAPAHESINTDFSDYVWPTDAGNIGTSTFGEYRRTHFHGGIDISTGNTTGYRVFAVRDGYVARIRVSPIGYGKMLYVRHADGFYSTYAHLKHFNVEIDARVALEQTRQESFDVDINCSPNELPVRKGELIAYTGDTGVGTPHLHFEIRDEKLDPINPLLCTEFSFPDHIAPVIKRVAISPLGEFSTVNGSSSPRIFSVRPTRKNQLKIAGTIQLSGEIGFGVSVTDRSNGSGYRHGVYSHRLFLDDTLVYTVQLDRVPGRNAHEIGFYYDWNLRDQGRGRFEKLYADSPNGLVFYSPKKPHAGIVNTAEFTDGPHTFRIVSTDFNNNSTEVTGKLTFNNPPRFWVEEEGNELRVSFAEISKINKVQMFTRKNGSEDWNLKTMTPVPYTEGDIIRVPDARQRYDVVKVIAENSYGTHSLPVYHFLHKPNGQVGTVKLDHEVLSDFVRVHLKATHPITETPTVTVYEGNSKRTINLTALEIDNYVGAFHPLESYTGTRRIVAEVEVNGRKATTLDEFDLYPIVAGKSGAIAFDNGKLTIQYDSASVYKTVFMQVEKHPDPEAHYTLLPDNTILRGELKVTVANNQPKEGEGLYFTGLSGWELLDMASDQGKKIFTGTITRTLGGLIIKSDEIPPNISRLSISRASSGRPTFSFRYGDNLSGVEYKELKTYIDGVVIIAEVDGEHHRATYASPRPLERGSHRLTIRIKDKMGNSNVVERLFSVR